MLRAIQSYRFSNHLYDSTYIDRYLHRIQRPVFTRRLGVNFESWTQSYDRELQRQVTVKIYEATGSQVRLENKNIFFYFENALVKNVVGWLLGPML
jgi:hypothetical protein